MEKQHRDKLGEFKRNIKFKNIDGKSENLDTIIIRLRNAGFIVPNEEVSYPEIIEFCHPFLYMRYIVDWKAVKDCFVPRGHGNGLSFGKEVCKQWEELCWRNHFWNYGTFKCFKKIDDLRAAIDKLVGTDNIYWKDGTFIDLEARLETDKRNEDAVEEARKKEEAQKKEEQRLALIAENKAKEAARIAEEQARQKAFDEMQKQSEAIKNPVWSRSDVPVKKKTGRPKKNDVFEESLELGNALNPFEEADMCILESPLPQVKDNQLLMLFEGSISVSNNSHIYTCGEISPKAFNGNNYICVKADTNYNNSSKKVINSLMNYYNAKRYILFTLGENESHNDSISAYRIIDVKVE